jgi:hypothetical protein
MFKLIAIMTLNVTMWFYNIWTVAHMFNSQIYVGIDGALYVVVDAESDKKI